MLFFSWAPAALLARLRALLRAPGTYASPPVPSLGNTTPEPQALKIGETVLILKVRIRGKAGQKSGSGSLASVLLIIPWPKRRKKR